MARTNSPRDVFFNLRQRFVKHIRIHGQGIEFLVGGQTFLRDALQLRLKSVVIALRPDPAFADHLLQQQYRRGSWRLNRKAVRFPICPCQILHPTIPRPIVLTAAAGPGRQARRPSAKARAVLFCEQTAVTSANSIRFRSPANTDNFSISFSNCRGFGPMRATSSDKASSSISLLRWRIAERAAISARSAQSLLFRRQRVEVFNHSDFFQGLEKGLPPVHLAGADEQPDVVPFETPSTRRPNH